MNNNQPICIIPARGGSKRIPRKNIKLFHGKPMIAHSIETALQSNLFSQVIVSTDDFEIAEIAEKFGANVPFMRPDELANDFATTGAVMAHTVDFMNKNGWNGSVACCLYATAPFVQIIDLKMAFEKLIELDCLNNLDYVFSATRFSFPIQRALKLAENGTISMFQPEMFAVRSQDLPEAYHDAGQFYFGTVNAWLAQKPIFNSHSKTVILPNHRVQDIDNEEDWLRAEMMWRVLQEMGK